MDDLFEKLKAEPPVKNVVSKPTVPSDDDEPPLKKICADVNEIAASLKPDVAASSPKQRSASSTPVFNFNTSRSNSPKEVANETKSKPPASNKNSDDDEAPPLTKSKRSSKDSDAKETDIIMNTTTTPSPASETPKKQMPTKAQQKLFEMPVKKSDVVDAAAKNKDDDDLKDITTTVAVAASAGKSDLKVKRCRVRVKRDDLQKLREQFSNELSAKKAKKSKPKPKNKTDKKASPEKPLQKAGRKRKADAGSSPPAKKGKNDTTKSTGSPTGKKNKPTGFFIKLTNNLKRSPPTAKDKQTSPTKSKDKETKSPQANKEKPTRKAAPRSAANSSYSSGTAASTTKATKFTRTQLIRQFGKRFFNSRVRIARCRHPMMLTFESNARARKMKAKNKSKNLSVSFKEQVEIIGFSDTESSEGDEANGNAAAKGGKPTLLVNATPLHLKKVENGKVIDDIEFDPKLFGVPDSSENTSTPLRKKLEKKSYSPLKDDSSPSARSELLKSANEKLPPSALRRLPAEEEDDEDDECEWIVPIDVPERRLSRNNSITEKDGKISADDKVQKDVNDDNGATVAAKPTDVQIAVESKQSKDDKELSTLNAAPVNEKSEQVNGNDAEKADKNDEENTAEAQAAETTLADVSKNDFPALLLESESTTTTPRATCTPEKHATPDLLVKTAIDKLAEDMEKNESAVHKEKLILNNVATGVESA